MLIPRLLTAVVLILLVIAGIFYLPPLWFELVATVFVLLGVWEYTVLFWQQSLAKRIIFLSASLVTFAVLEYTMPIIGIAAGVVWWIVAPYFLVRYIKEDSHLFLLDYEISSWLLGFLIFVPCLLSIIELKLYFGAKYLLYILAIIWATDIGAYFVGKFFGKHKLASLISPKKTIEGLFGGLASALVVAVIGNILLTNHFNWTLLLLSIVASLWSVIGDLFESLLKRQTGVKDSGGLLPGHGGIYDRIDSLTAALPIFTFGIFFIGV